MPDVDTLLAQFRDGDRLALSRLLTMLARGEQTRRILAAVPQAEQPFRVAITGSAGVGKSTLIGKLLDPIRQAGSKVAVLACDPQSPLSGGALLGDRFRMSSQPDDNIFIRSLPAVSGHGAVAEHLEPMTRLLAAFGFDVILIETVGAGQGDTAVADLADVVVLLLQPETGDDLQWEKAGVLEVAGVIAVQKADLPRADQVAAQVRAALELSVGPPIPVVLVSAKTGQGVAELWQTVIAARRSREDLRSQAEPGNEELLRLAQAALAARFAGLNREQKAAIEKLAMELHQGRMTEREAGEACLRLLGDQDQAGLMDCAS
jgi:LAO/AO transport system kinase